MYHVEEGSYLSVITRNCASLPVEAAGDYRCLERISMISNVSEWNRLCVHWKEKITPNQITSSLHFYDTTSSSLQVHSPCRCYVHCGPTVQLLPCWRLKNNSNLFEDLIVGSQSRQDHWPVTQSMEWNSYPYKTWDWSPRRIQNGIDGRGQNEGARVYRVLLTLTIHWNFSNHSTRQSHE